jgi:hypothetical protein
MKFEDLKFEAHPNGMGGIRAVHTFPNGFGVSVINASFSYGGDKGLFEMAILFKDRLTYDTPLTDDVLGNLTEEEVSEYLAKVEALTAADLKESAAPSTANPVEVINSLMEMLKGK